MTSRKIFNYDSIILRDETFKEFGYYPEKYGESSAKFVIAICRYCGEHMKVRKGFFNKSGSACHKKCKIEEMKQQKSPFSDPTIRKKAQKTIEEKYGFDRKEIGEKISKSKNTEESKKKTKMTVKEKYGVENVFQSEEIKQKIKDSHLERYGVDHPMRNKIIKENRKKTIQKKYGVDNVMQHKKVKDKARETNWMKYGVPTPLQNKSILEKARKTNKERYGTDTPLQNKSILGKMINTNIDKYGNSCPMQNEEIQKEIRRRNIEKWGHENPFGSDVIREKIAETMIKNWGVKYPQQSKCIRKTTSQNNIKKYNFGNPMQNEEIKKIFLKTVINNESGNFDRINLLRSNNNFWKDLENQSIKQLSSKYGIKQSSLSRALCDDEFRERYKETYSFPKFQTQKEIFDTIKSFGFDCDFNTRRVIPPLELDIYIPSKKFAIEYNGNLWHSEAWIKNPKEARMKHLKKTNLCKEKDIRLFHIFEHQWASRKPQMLNFIKTILGCNKEKIAARKCLLTHTDSNDFINMNHIQGNTHHVLKYFNLEYEGEIVASMTASRHHRQNAGDNCIVLSRLCFKDGLNIQGGSSKLFKYFVEWSKGEGYNRVISWSDNCWTDGGIYNVLGFILEKEYGPDYFYYDVLNHRVYSKQSQKKGSVGCPSGFTEREWCMERGLYRIYDCGKKRWVLEL